MATCRFHLQPGRFRGREWSYITEWARWLAGKSNDYEAARRSIPRSDAPHSRNLSQLTRQRAQHWRCAYALQSTLCHYVNSGNTSSTKAWKKTSLCSASYVSWQHDTARICCWSSALLLCAVLLRRPGRLATGTNSCPHAAPRSLIHIYKIEAPLDMDIFTDIHVKFVDVDILT